jgi:hypothetical protein
MFTGTVDGTIPVEWGQDPGFSLICLAVGAVGGGPVAMFVVMAALAVGLVLGSYRRYTPFFFVAVLVYFSHTFIAREMLQIRAGLAAALCLYSMRHIIDGRGWRFLGVMAAAISIHAASSVFLLVWPVARSGMGRRTMFALLGVSLAVGLLFPVGSLFGRLEAVELLVRAQAYAAAEMGGEQLGVFGSPTTIKQLLIFVTGLMFYDRLSERVWGFRAFMTSYFLAVCWLMVWNDIPTLAARLSTFFSITEGILLASYMYLIERRSRIFYVALVVVFALMMLRVHTTGGLHPYVPSVRIF